MIVQIVPEGKQVATVGFKKEAMRVFGAPYKMPSHDDNQSNHRQFAPLFLLHSYLHKVKLSLYSAATLCSRTGVSNSSVPLHLTARYVLVASYTPRPF